MSEESPKTAGNAGSTGGNRSKGPRGRSSSAAIDFNPGSRVEVKDHGNNIWYPAKIVEVDAEEKEILIHFENWSARYDEWISMDSARLREAVQPPKKRLGSVKSRSKGFKVGEKVMAAWSDSKKYEASVKSVLSDDYYEVIFYDGFIKKLKGSRMVKINNKNSAPTGSSAGSKAAAKRNNRHRPSTSATPTPPGTSTSPKEEPTPPSKRIFPYDPDEDIGTKEERRRRKRKFDSVADLFNKKKKAEPFHSVALVEERTQETSALDGEVKVNNVAPPSEVVPRVQGGRKRARLRQRQRRRPRVKAAQPVAEAVDSTASDAGVKENAGEGRVPVAEVPVTVPNGKKVNGDMEGVDNDEEVDFLPSRSGRRATIVIRNRSLPDGWRKKAIQRQYGVSAGKWDVYVLSPEGRKFRSRKQLQTYLEVSGLKLDSEKITFTLGDRLMKLARAKSTLPQRKVKLEKRPAPEVHASPTPPPLNTPIPQSPTPSPTTEEALLPKKEVVRKKVVPPMIHTNDQGNYVCPKDGCSKVFRKENLLQMHVKHYHPEYSKFIGAAPNVADLAYARTIGEPLEEVPRSSVAPRRNSQLKAEVKDDLDWKPEMKTVKSPVKLEEESDGEAVPKGVLKPILDWDKLVNSMDLPPAPAKKEVGGGSGSGTTQVAALPDGKKKVMFAEDVIRRDRETRRRKSDSHKSGSKRRRLSSSRDSRRKSVSGGDLSKYQQSEEDQVKQMVAPDRRVPVVHLEKLELTTDSQGRLCYTDPHDKQKSFLVSDGNLWTEEGKGKGKGKSSHKRIPEFPVQAIVPKKEVINCVCGVTEEDGLMIQCDQCLCWQHGYCCNIEEESQVPEKYVCVLCRHPVFERRSMHYVHDQDWMKQGKMPSFSAAVLEDDEEDLPRVDPELAEHRLQKSFDLTADLRDSQMLMYSLSLKMHIASQEDHQKLYLWNKRQRPEPVLPSISTAIPDPATSIPVSDPVTDEDKPSTSSAVEEDLGKLAASLSSSEVQRLLESEVAALVGAAEEMEEEEEEEEEMVVLKKCTETYGDHSYATQMARPMDAAAVVAAAVALPNGGNGGSDVLGGDLELPPSLLMADQKQLVSKVKGLQPCNGFSLGGGSAEVRCTSEAMADAADSKGFSGVVNFSEATSGGAEALRDQGVSDKISAGALDVAVPGTSAGVSGMTILQSSTRAPSVSSASFMAVPSTSTGNLGAGFVNLRSRPVTAEDVCLPRVPNAAVNTSGIKTNTGAVGSSTREPNVTIPSTSAMASEPLRAIEAVLDVEAAARNSTSATVTESSDNPVVNSGTQTHDAKGSALVSSEEAVLPEGALDDVEDVFPFGDLPSSQSSQELSSIASLDLSLSQSEIEQLASSVERNLIGGSVIAPAPETLSNNPSQAPGTSSEAVTPPVTVSPNVPEPEARIDSQVCRVNLLEDISESQDMLAANLDSIEAQLEALEREQPGRPEGAGPDDMRMKITLQMLLRDLATVQQVSEFN